MAGEHDVLFRFKSAGRDEELFNLVRMEGREALSDLYEFHLDLASKDPDINIGDVLQNNAVIEMEWDGDVVHVHGIVSGFVQCDRGPEWVNYQAVVVPRLFTLGLNQQCQIYQDKSMPTIVRELLTEDGLLEGEDFELRLRRTDYASLEYVVQYQESDLAFIRRLMEHEGLFFFFEQSATKEKLIIADDLAAYGLIAGAPTVTYRDARGVNPGGEAVSSLQLWQELRPRNVVLRDYNWRAPGVEMLARASATAGGRGTFTEYGDHFKSPEEGRVLARIRGEELACREVVYRGQGACRAFRAGARFTLIDHFRASSNIEYLLVEVTHRGEQLGVVGTASGGEAGRPSYTNSFEAIPATTQFRPARLTPKPRIYGTLNAIVDASGSGEYAEVDDLGRYKIRLPFDASTNGGGKASRYIRMAQPYSGEDAGLHFPLHKGAEVILTHIDGDPDRPIISAAVPNTATGSPVTSQNPTQSVIQTGGQNRIEIEDQDGARYVHLSTPEETNGQTFLRLGNAGTALAEVVPVEGEAPSPPPPPDVIITIDPAAQAVRLEGSLQFTPTVTRTTDFRVTWSIESGGAEQGSITEQGLYTAPPTLPAATSVTVRVTSVANPARFAEATVVVYEEYIEPAHIFMVPATARMELSETFPLQAIVVGAAEKSVTWEVVGGAANGTISAQGLYSPPNTMPASSPLPNLITIRATAVADASKTAECTISLYPDGSRTQGIVSVIVSPRGISLGPAGTQAFTALVANAGQNQAVTWEVVDGGGTIDAGGNYTAPTGFSSPTLATIRARSAANSARFGEAQVILFQPTPTPVNVYVVPEEATVQLGDTVDLTAIVAGTSNQAVTWSVVGDDAAHSKGTVSTSGLYTPPAALPASTSVTLRATSQANSAMSADATITLVPAGTLIEVVIDPPGKTVVATRTQVFTAFVRGSQNQGVTWSKSGEGTISTNSNGSCTYTAPAADKATGTTSLTATSVVNPAKSASVTITLIAQGQIATFTWDKITDKLNALKGAGFSEGDIAIGANNSVSLFRKNNIQEVQEEQYVNVVADAYTRYGANNWTHTNGFTTTMLEQGSLTTTGLMSLNATAGFLFNFAFGVFVNATIGLFASVTAGASVDMYLGMKMTFNYGRNFKFFDVDDYEVCDKTSSVAANNAVELKCGPPSPEVSMLAGFAAGVKESAQSLWKTVRRKAKPSTPHTSAVLLQPGNITIEISDAAPATGGNFVYAAVKKNLLAMKLEEDKFVFRTVNGSGQFATTISATADELKLHSKKITADGEFEVLGALKVSGIALPDLPDLAAAVAEAKLIKQKRDAEEQLRQQELATAALFSQLPGAV